MQGISSDAMPFPGLADALVLDAVDNLILRMPTGVVDHLAEPVEERIPHILELVEERLLVNLAVQRLERPGRLVDGRAVLALPLCEEPRIVETVKVFDALQRFNRHRTGIHLRLVLRRRRDGSERHGLATRIRRGVLVGGRDGLGVHRVALGV